jgi:hypothetical protein
MFGRIADLYLKGLERFPLDQLTRNYAFVDNDEFGNQARADQPKAMQIYWSEILMRAHLAAATAILRSLKWIDGASVAAKAKNLLVFSAAFRGLIESSADTFTALNAVPETFARDYSMICQAIAGKADKLVIGKEMEDTLIHYAFARKTRRSEVTPESHRARQVREYMDILERGQVPRVIECYSELCDLTHPGASSVWMFLHAKSEREFRVEPNRDEGVIRWFLSEYEDTLARLFMFAFNSPIMTLAVLNYFPLPEFHTPGLWNWDLSGIPAWRSVQRYLSGISLSV